MPSAYLPDGISVILTKWYLGVNRRFAGDTKKAGCYLPVRQYLMLLALNLVISWGFAWADLRGF